MTDTRSAFSSSARARATSSTTVVGRNAPASSCASVVRRASNSAPGPGVAALEGGLGMILANVRGRLRAQDLLLVALALARGDAARRARYERLLLEEGPDELLDEPDLLDALLALRTLVVPSPALFAYVAVRHTLRAAGVDDRALADYLAALPARSATPARRAPRRRDHLPLRRRAVPHLAGGVQPVERPGILPERQYTGQDTSKSLGSWERGAVPSQAPSGTAPCSPLPIHSSKNLVGTVVAASTSCSADFTKRTTIGNDPLSSSLRCMIPAMGPSSFRITRFHC